jgi:hypothetical protein
LSSSSTLCSDYVPWQEYAVIGGCEESRIMVHYNIVISNVITSVASSTVKRKLSVVIGNFVNTSLKKNLYVISATHYNIVYCF